jgi:RNA polymerase sigma factor (sigma-70 family)
MTINDEELLRALDSYTGFVRKVAYTAITSSPTIDVEDLFQIGQLAVLRALKSYDPTCGRNIKSYVCSCIRQDIYNEAAHFLGVFTVDHRVTEMGSKINKFVESGKTDQEIAEILNKRYPGRNWTNSKVYDLRLAYTRRQAIPIDVEPEEIPESLYIEQFLQSIVQDDNDRIILRCRILGDSSAIELAGEMDIPIKKLYSLESSLKSRIKVAIQNIV